MGSGYVTRLKLCVKHVLSWLWSISILILNIHLILILSPFLLCHRYMHPLLFTLVLNVCDDVETETESKNSDGSVWSVQDVATHASLSWTSDKERDAAHTTSATPTRSRQSRPQCVEYDWQEMHNAKICLWTLRFCSSVLYVWYITLETDTIPEWSAFTQLTGPQTALWEYAPPGSFIHAWFMLPKETKVQIFMCTQIIFDNRQMHDSYNQDEPFSLCTCHNSWRVSLDDREVRYGLDVGPIYWSVPPTDSITQTRAYVNHSHSFIFLASTSLLLTS